MKLFNIHDTAFFVEPQEGFPVKKDSSGWSYKLGRNGALLPATSEVISIEVSPVFAGPGKVYRAGISPSGILVPEWDKNQIQFEYIGWQDASLFHPLETVLVSAGYNTHQQHLGFESTIWGHEHRTDESINPDLVDNHPAGVIFSHAPQVSNNWNRLSFIAVMQPGMVISAVIQVTARGETAEQSVPILEMTKDGTFRYLYTELPVGNSFDSDDRWMNGLNRQ